MYAFVENWIVGALGMRCEPYFIGDESCAIVGVEEYNHITNCFLAVNERLGRFSVGVSNVHSSVSGMHTILMEFWEDENILYELTDERTKAHPLMQKFMNMENPRYNKQEVLQALLQAHHSLTQAPTTTAAPELFPPEDGYVDRLAASGAQVQTPTPAIPAQAVAQEVPPAPSEAVPEPEIPNVQTRGRDFINKLRQSTIFSNHERHVSSKGFSVYMHNDLNFLDDAFCDMSDKLEKNIVVISRFHPRVNTYITDMDELDEHTIMIHANPSSQYLINTFSNATSRAETRLFNHEMCLGAKLSRVYVVKGLNLNQEIHDINKNTKLNQQEKDEAILQITNNHKNSAYYKYDAVYKDCCTNVVFAVKQKCWVYLLFQPDTESETETRILLQALTDRYYLQTPYAIMYEHDKHIMENRMSETIDEYVKCHVKSSKEIFDKMTEDMEAAHQEYVDCYQRAQMALKQAQDFQVMIKSFDIKKFDEEQKKQANMAIEEALKIEKVSSIHIEKGVVHVFTKNIYAKDSRHNTWHDIGTFHILINLFGKQYEEKQTIRIFNTKHLGLGMNSQFQAPHVWEDGHICHGNLLSTITTAYKNKNLFDIIYQIVIFLESANTSDGAGQYVNTWPQVSEEEAKGIATYAEKNEQVFDEQLIDLIPVRTGG